MIGRFFAYASGSVGLLLMLTAALPARTILLTAEDADEMASISSKSPRQSWVMIPPGEVLNIQPSYYWHSHMTFLIRFPIKDHVPKGQRVTKAELSIAPNYVATAPEIHVRRILAEWGTGVCHDYRMTHPKKVEWNQPGGRGNSTDRANKDSAVFKFLKVGEQTADVTEDVELWYTGGANNRGWIMTLEPEGHVAYIGSPHPFHAAGAKTWKLQVTFEPQ